MTTQEDKFEAPEFQIRTLRMVWKNEVDTSGLYEGDNNRLLTAKNSVYKAKIDPSDGSTIIFINDKGYVFPPNSYEVIGSSGNLRKELEQLLNRQSAERFSNTPDFILASFMFGCLILFDQAVNKREKWYERDTPGQKDTRRISDDRS